MNDRSGAKVYHFTAISPQYDPLYILAGEKQITYINVNKNSLISRVINLSEVKNVQFNVHGDIIFKLKDFELDQIQFKSIFYSYILRYFKYNKQDVVDYTVFDFAVYFLVIHDVEVQLDNNRSQFTLSAEDSSRFDLQIGKKKLTFDFQSCKVHCLERQYFVLYDSEKKLKFKAEESFEKSFLLSYFFKAKILYYQTYVRYYNEKNKLAQQQINTLVRSRLNIYQQDFDDDDAEIVQPIVVPKFANKELEYKKAIRYLYLIIQAIQASYNRKLGGVLYELLVLEGKLLVYQTKKQEGQVDVISELNKTLTGYEGRRGAARKGDTQ